jgi:TolB-like protein
MKIKKIIILAVVLLLAACSGTQDSTQNPSADFGTCGVLNGSFVGDWFDYYKRAITWMDCEQWQNAESDLLAAIRVRSQDKRRVYTSGMHFLNNYFPNRELGVTLYYQQKYDAAVDALLRSFEQFPSEKARLFLQLALRKSAQYQQADQQAPKITKTQETTDFIYLTLSDDVYVDRLMVNGQHFAIKSSVVIDNTTITFEPLSNAIDIVLDKNAYRGQTLALTLIDVLEKQTPLILGVSLDITPPVISVTGKSQNGGQTQWQFSATDHQSDITSITVDGKAVQVKQTFNVSSSAQKILVRVKDAAGNVAQQSFINAMPEDLMLDVEMASQVTQENQVLLSIFMQSPKGLRQVSINNEIIPLQGQSETFLNYLFSLQSGVNNINIALSDGSETQYFSGAVMKELPEGFSLNNRLKLAVFPFDCEQNKTASCWENNQVFDSYFSEFSQRRRFQVVSRNNLGERVQQLKLCEFDLSEKCAWEATQLTGSQAMLVAEQTLRTTNNITTVEIYAKIIDASSGEILITFDTYQQLDDHSLDSRYLANKIHSYFPLLDFSLDGDKVSVNNSSFVPWHKMPMVGHQAPSSEEPCFIGKLVSKGNTLTLASAPSCQLQQLQNL